MILKSPINLYWLTRLFDSNEKQKFLNRPATDTFTLRVWKKIQSCNGETVNLITRKILEYNREFHKANICEICIVLLVFQNSEKKRI